MNNQPSQSSFSRGWQLGAIAWNFVLNNKTVFIFPIINLMIALPTALIIGTLTFGIDAIAFFSSLGHQGATHGAINFKTIIAFISFTALTLVICQTITDVALSFYVEKLFTQQPTTVSQSFKRALNRLLVITEWSFFEVLIGKLIELLQAKKQTTTSQILAALLSTTISVSWSIVSFFIVPIIAFEDKGFIDSIKTSTSLIKKTWGESLGASLQITTRVGLYLLGWFTFLGLIFYGIHLYAQSHPLSGVTTLLLILLGLIGFIVPAITASFISRTMTNVIKTALYNFSQGNPTGPFTPPLLQNAFTQEGK